MKDKILYSMLFVFLAVFIASAIFWLPRQGTRTVHFKTQAIRAELAQTDSARQVGLSGRNALCSNCGMLFLFPAPGDYSFWMKGMRFNLDILWLNDKQVVSMAKNVSLADQASVIAPGVMADAVLEINAGKSDEWGIGLGARLQY